MVFTDVPATYSADGRRCAPPSVGDAVTGLLMIVLPLLAPVLWLADEDTGQGPLDVFVGVLVLAVGIVVALHGMMSDLSPLRRGRRYVPMTDVVLGGAYAVGLPWGVAMLIAPGSAAAQAAARRGEILTTATPDPSATPTPPSSLDLWVASGSTVGIGRVVVGLALLCLAVLTVRYVRALLVRDDDAEMATASHVDASTA